MSETKRLGEFELIGRYFKPLAARLPGALGLTDDAAVLDIPAGRQLVVTHDALVAGVHFLTDDSPADVAAKALAVNVSDLASMGAAPLGYTLTLALTRDLDEGWLEAFSDGLAVEQERYGIALAGGDTVSTPGPLSVTVCAFGTVPAGQALTRSGALPGDAVFVTGTIGDAALGLLALTSGLGDLAEGYRNALIDRYRHPQPRIALAQLLVGSAHAAIDVSDGLVADLGHICEESRLRARIDADRVPLSDAARAVVGADDGCFQIVLTGGDDYEILFSAPSEAREAIARISAVTGVPVTEIGRMEEAGSAEPSPVVGVYGAGGLELEIAATGFQHF